MKTLSIVTMFFLPGTFVSSLFSMPLFDWDATNSSYGNPAVWKPRLGIYMAITAPLTLLTFTIWGLCTFLQTLGKRRQAEMARQKLRLDVKMSETGVLARRWTTLSLGSADVIEVKTS
jgi:hypothetical protein